jgi:hypothetical protein
MYSLIENLVKNHVIVMIDIKFLDSMDIFRAQNIKEKKIRDVKAN